MAVHEWLKMQHPSFCWDGTCIVSRWDIFNNVLVDCVKKWQYFSWI